MFGVGTRQILGMNARNRLFTSQNSASARAICHSKFFTKKLMNKKGIGAAKILAIIENNEQLLNFQFEKLSGNFVIKPSNGSGGKGIMVFTKKNSHGDFITTLGETWTVEQIVIHCLDILEGKYSSHPGAQTAVIVEERVEVHPDFAKLAYKGTPDIRVIVYNSIPVMAMLRLPTEESEGRANLHQGAIGVGVDIATGLTTHAITSGGIEIKTVPGSKRKLSGFWIPHWHDVLLTAVNAANAAGLTYGGVDIFIDKARGPLVVELNTSPGLQIQLANRQGLKRRLERVSDLQVLNSEHGIKIAQSLFRSNIINKFLPPDEKATISFNESGEIMVKKKKYPVDFVIDTGRKQSSISQELAFQLGLCEPDALLWFQKIDSGEKSPVIEVNFMLKGKKVKAAMLLSKALDKSRYKIRLGRNDLSNFIISKTA